ncbi:PREDICTED: splicing factor, arginine/serine-rich 19, partial [Haliaeetus leucocephalus]|uniref:splicing factor, arginine/serine-rich 19 n=1 Tax=Haliaeetus leucocephalus TaxID=52644 RepID=UPI00053CDF46
GAGAGAGRGRAAESRPPRLPEGDDFLSLHADSDEEGDFGADSQPDPRWKTGGSDLRRKILSQRRLRAPPSPRSPSAASRKKPKRSRERGGAAWGGKKPPEPPPKPKERHRRRGSRSRSRRRSWSRGRRSRSREKRRSRRSGSGERPRRPRHKEKHRGEGKKKKKQRSRSRERRPSRRPSREGPGDPKTEKGGEPAARRREARAVVPPSVQELNDADLFAIKRTITVSRREGTPEPAKREVLYDSEGLSFEGFSDREPPEAPARGGKGEPRPSAEVKKEKERKRSRPEERPPAREKYKKKFKETPGRPLPPPPEPAKGEKEKAPRGEREKAPRKSKGGGHKEGEGVPAKPPASRKVKLQSKVAILIREGVSSTTAAGKESGSGGGSGGGSIGVKFSRDAESRAPFLKPEEKAAAEAKAGGKAEPPKETGGVKVKKAKAPKAKAGLKKPKGTGGKAKAGGEARKKRKAKPKGSLKKSKADSCSQGAGSPPLRLPPKVEPIWSGSEKSGSSPKPPSPPPGKTT